MQLFDEIEKIYQNMLLEYEKDAIKIIEVYGTNKFYVGYGIGMKNLLTRRALKYGAVAKELEMETLITKNMDKLFKKTYKKLDKLILFTIIDIRTRISRKEKTFKLGLVTGARSEHQLFLNCFKLYENEVRKLNANI